MFDWRKRKDFLQNHPEKMEVRLISYDFGFLFLAPRTGSADQGSSGQECF